MTKAKVAVWVHSFASIGTYLVIGLLQILMLSGFLMAIPHTEPPTSDWALFGVLPICIASLLWFLAQSIVRKAPFLQDEAEESLLSSRVKQLVGEIASASLAKRLRIVVSSRAPARALLDRTPGHLTLVLDEAYVARCGDETLRAVVAHELQHAWTPFVIAAWAISAVSPGYVLAQAYLGRLLAVYLVFAALVPGLFPEHWLGSLAVFCGIALAMQFLGWELAEFAHIQEEMACDAFATVVCGSAEPLLAELLDDEDSPAIVLVVGTGPDGRPFVSQGPPQVDARQTGWRVNALESYRK